jgi:hypothetical protein
MKSMKTRLIDWLRTLFDAVQVAKAVKAAVTAVQADESKRIIDSAHLIDHFAVTCTAYCSCGSKTIHHLTLVNTSDCARCGNTIGIRSIHYFRQSPGDLPEPRVEVGYLRTERALSARKTAGVH